MKWRAVPSALLTLIAWCSPDLTTDSTGAEHDPARRDDRAHHLARVCAQFPRTVSTQNAHQLARLPRVQIKITGGGIRVLS